MQPPLLTPDLLTPEGANRSWHRLSCEEVLTQLGSQVEGLSQTEAKQRLERWGPNELPTSMNQSAWQILVKQLTASIVLILLAAALIALALQDYGDAAAILAIVGFNTVLGFWQEHQASQSLAALRQLTIPQVRVRREGAVQTISSRELVLGDWVLLEAGNRVPADCRLIEVFHLRIQEGSLTGEAEPVDKTTTALTLGMEGLSDIPLRDNPISDVPLGERTNMAYMGSMVTYGRGVGVVTQTGIQTELGKIATAIQSIGPNPTPLQQRLDQLGWILGIAIVFICAGVFGLGVIRGEPWVFMLLEAVSLAVAAIPEGLPAIVTIALALGAQRLLHQNALIRHLPAVETLGSVTVICADKTGTLTQGRMAVATVMTANHRVDWGADGNPADGVTQPPELALLWVAAALCNNALLLPQPTHPLFVALGDPTETVLVEASAQVGLWKTDLDHQFPRLAEIPFDAGPRRMVTLHRLEGASRDQIPAIRTWRTQLMASGYSRVAFVKGAPEGLLPMCSSLWQADQIIPLDPVQQGFWLNQADTLAKSGQRVLAIAFSPVSLGAVASEAGLAVFINGIDSSPEGLTTDGVNQWVLLGLVGLMDPPRPRVKEAVESCLRAGIRPILITGDHPLTAQAIAQEVGITTANRPMVTGQALDHASPADLDSWVREVSVFSRVTPQHKLLVVQALQKQGEIVAMTGDGINDAPALKQADIGIAMGLTGTDVAKEAADMVLLDDRFSTIVAATREGRVIYDNIRKFIRYTLTGNLGELWLLLVAPLIGLPLPLFPLQILWINLLADGLLAVALSLEPPERYAMERPPHPPQESLFSRGLGWSIAWIGSLLGVLLVGLSYVSWALGIEHWRSLVLTALLGCRVGLVLAMRSERDSWFDLDPNLALLFAIGVTCGLHGLILYVPLLACWFQVEALSVGELTVCGGVGLAMMVCVELEKKVGKLLSLKSPE